MIRLTDICRWLIDTTAATTGIPHLWRAELPQRLAAIQNADGSLTNLLSPRWLEDQPAIVTACALLALQETRK